MSDPRTDDLLCYGGIALVTVAIATGAYALLSADDTAVHRAFRPYVRELDKGVRLLYLRVTGAQIAQRQAVAIAVLVAAAAVLKEFLFVAAAAVVAVAPRVWLASRVAERKRKVDGQLDTFLTTLSNALKASPSLGDALATAANLMRSPLKEDLEFALKENRLGAPLDQALMGIAQRVDSRAFDTALTTILIGRQTGGDLPKILERSAATLREMARLEGVVRGKTAEGRMQAYVLGAVPFVIVAVLNSMDPEWLRPLTTTFVGYVIMAIAAAMWVAAVVASRKILNVDV